MHMRMIQLVALTTLSLLTLAGCQSVDRSQELSISDESMGGFDAVESLPGVGEDLATSEMAPADAPVNIQRQEIITGNLYLTVDDPVGVADQVETITQSAGGRVDSRNDYADIGGENPSSFLWIRIPTDVLNDTLDEIESLGIVESKSLNSQDVTLQVVDINARIAVLEDSISRLLELLNNAETTTDIVAIETALSERQSELDSLNSQRNYLSDQIDFASIGVDLRSPEVAPDRDPGGFVDGIIAGWEAMLAFFAGAVVFFGVILPWIGLLVALVALIWLVVKIRSRRSTNS